MGLFDFIPSYRDIVPRDSILDVLAETAKVASGQKVLEDIVNMLRDKEDEDD